MFIVLDLPRTKYDSRMKYDRMQSQNNIRQHARIGLEMKRQSDPVLVRLSLFEISDVEFAAETYRKKYGIEIHAFIPIVALNSGCDLV